MQLSKVTLLALSIVTAQLAIANPLPEPVTNVDVTTSELDKRWSCWINYLPSCCTFVQYQSWPSIQPGLSYGCVTEASEPGGVCPTTGANTHACCQQSPVHSGSLYYQGDGSVYCYGGV
ncbi:hypothetical protein JOM56_004252 [Amanita muscaria]